MNYFIRKSGTAHMDVRSQILQRKSQIYHAFPRCACTEYVNYMYSLVQISNLSHLQPHMTRCIHYFWYELCPYKLLRT